MGRAIIKILATDPVPEGGKFLHAKEEVSGYETTCRPKQDCLSWLWPNPQLQIRKTPIMGTFFYYEIEQSEEARKQ